MRFNSTRTVGPGSFDPLRPVRAAEAVYGRVDNIASDLQATEDAQFQQRDREARLWARVERTRIDRELAGDIDQVSQEMEEGGAGFADAAMGRLDGRYNEARRRAGSDPLKKKYLDEMYAVEKEGHRKSFETFERDTGRQYSYDQHLLAVDDYRQSVGRTVAVPPRTGYRAGLKQTESGGRADVVNDEGFMGFYQFGDDRLNDYRRATGATFTNDEFLKNPALQERVMDWHEADIDAFIADEGLTQYVGAQIDGVTMTRNAMQAVAHLGGKKGLQKFLTSGGSYNPEDSNGTSLLDYARTHGGTDANGLPIHTGPLPDLKSDPAYVAALDDLHAQIDAMEITKAQKQTLKRNAEAELATAALKTMGEQNAPAALSLLQSGKLDKILSYKQTEGFEDAITRTLEREIAAAGKAQQQVFKDEAHAAADDWLAWSRDGRQGEEPRLTQDQKDVLPRETRQAILEAPAIADAVAAAETVNLSQAGELLDALRPSGEGYAPEQAGYDKAVEIIEERMKEAAVTQHLEASRAAGLVPNTGDKEVAKRIESDFESAVAGAEVPLEAAAEFIEENGVIPDGFNNMAAQIMGGESLEAKVALSGYVGQLFDDNSRLLAAEGNDAIDMAIAADQYVRAGVTREEAVKLAEQIAHPVNPGQAKANRDLFTADRGAMREAAFGNFVDLIGEEDGRAELPPTAEGEYMQLVADKFAATGNIEVATRLAARAFLQRHDVTHIGNRRWVRNPAEARYGVYGEPKKDAAWIEEQALEHAKAQFDDANAVSLVALPDQDRESEPVYMVLASRPDGVFGTTVEEVSARFRPDRQKEIDGHELDSASAREAGILHAEIRTMQSQSSDVLQAANDVADAYDRGEATLEELEAAAAAWDAHKQTIADMQAKHADMKRGDKAKPPAPDPNSSWMLMQGREVE